jgi:hypothetical protein
MMPDVLLAAAEWHPRAVLRAQLIEEGYEVLAVESWDEAELLLSTGAVRPRTTIFALEQESNPEACLRTLARLLLVDTVLILTSPSVMAVAEINALGFPHVLSRPFSVRDVLHAVETRIGARA